MQIGTTGGLIGNKDEEARLFLAGEADYFAYHVFLPEADSPEACAQKNEQFIECLVIERTIYLIDLQAAVESILESGEPFTVAVMPHHKDQARMTLCPKRPD